MTDRDQHSRTELTCLWRHLRKRLAAWRPDWADQVGAEAAVFGEERLFSVAAPSNERIFEAFTVALLSGNTRWDRITRIRTDLRDPFANFDPSHYASLTDRDIEERIVAWFRERKAGSAGLRASLLRLRATAEKLSSYRDGDDSAYAYLVDARSHTTGSPEDLAIILATSKRWKLPGFGIALAAEALRNLGVDLGKPDRHILRAIGSWSLIDFARWDRRGAYTPPQATHAELLEAMLMVRSIAEANRLGVSHTNAVIWTAGAVSGARLTNVEFGEIARGCLRGGRAHYLGNGNGEPRQPDARPRRR